MAQRTVYKGTMTPLDNVFTDDEVVLEDGVKATIIKTETREYNIVLPRRQTTITYMINEGPLRGSFRIKSYFPEDELPILKNKGAIASLISWWKRRNPKRTNNVWHNHSFYREDCKS